MSDTKKIFDTDSDIDIAHLARLCRLSLSAEECEKTAKELKRMADYTYPRVKRGDTVLPFSYCSARSCMREDTAQKSAAEECKRILSLAPSVSDGYVSVPKVIKEEGNE